MRANHVLDHSRLIRSNLICRRRAPMRCRWWTDPCTQLDVNVTPHISTAHVFQVIWCIKRANMQYMCWTPFISATINPWLFVFGSAETAQKDTCCVQMLETRTAPHAYARFNRAFNVQIYIVWSDHLSVKNPSFIFQWRWVQVQKLTDQIWSKEARSWIEMLRCHTCISILCHQRESFLLTTLFNPQNHIDVIGAPWQEFEMTRGTL